MTNKNESATKLHELVRKIDTAMLVTRRADGQLVSRAMAVQEKAAPGADFWFAALRDSGKIAEIQGDPHVNLSFYRERSREWISVSGTAFVTDDRERIHQLYMPDWKAWFDDQGDPRHGTPDDPRMMLIGVRALSAHYLEVNKPRAVIAFEVMKGMVTGKAPQLGEEHAVSGDELRRS